MGTQHTDSSIKIRKRTQRQGQINAGNPTEK